MEIDLSNPRRKMAAKSLEAQDRQANTYAIVRPMGFGNPQQIYIGVEALGRLPSHTRRNQKIRFRFGGFVTPLYVFFVPTFVNGRFLFFTWD